MADDTAWGVSRDSLDPRLVASHGVVANTGGRVPDTCALAYDTTQRLLAVAFADGAVKLYGGAGLEATLVARVDSDDSDCGPVLLAFLPSSPLLVHVTPGPPCEVHVWNCRTCAKVTTCLWPASDAVSALCTLPPPWPVALFASSDGDASLTAAGVTAAWGLELRDWRLQCGFGGANTAEQTAGRVVSVDTIAHKGGQLLGLSASDEGALCVCDIQGQKVVTRTAAGECLLFATFASSTAAVTVHNVSGGSGTPLLRLWQLSGVDLVMVVELALPESTHGATLTAVACARHSHGAHIFMACDLGMLFLCRVMTSSSGGGCSVAPPVELAVAESAPRHMALLGTSLAHLTVATTDAATGATCTLLAVMTAPGECRAVQLLCTALATPQPLVAVTASLPLDTELRSEITAATVHAEEVVSPLLVHLHAQLDAPSAAQNTVLAVAEAPAEPHRAMVTCHVDGAVTVWDASAAALLPVATARTADSGAVACAALCPASALLVAARVSGSVTLHAVDTPSCDVVAEAQTGAAGVTCIALATGGVGLVAVGHDTGDVIVFSLPDLQRCGQLSADGGAVTQLQFCPGCDSATALLLMLRSSGAVTIAHCSAATGCRVVATGDAPSDGPSSKKRGSLFASKASTQSAAAAALSHAVALIALDASGGPCACVQAAIPGHFPRQPLPLPAGGDGDDVSDGEDDSGDAALKALLASSGGAAAGGLPPTRLVVFTATGAHALDVPPFDAADASPLRLVPQATQCLERGAPRIMAAGCCVAVGGTAAVLLDAACVIHIWDAATLAPVMTAPLAGSLPGALCERVQACQPECSADGDGTEIAILPSIFAIGRDGHSVACWGATSSSSPLGGCDALVRLELADEFCVPHPPPEYPPVNSLWSSARDAATSSCVAAPPPADDADGPRSSGAAGRLLNTFAGLKAGVARAAEKGKEKLMQALAEPGSAASGPGAWEAVFPPMPVATLVTSSAVTSPKVHPATNSREDRAALLGEESGDAPRMRSAEEIKAKYGRNVEVGEVSGTMGENLDKLRERGQKLSNIQDRTAAMEAEAQQFAENARKLTEMQGLKGLFRW